MVWEYEVLPASDAAGLLKNLNVMGEMGWEAVGTFTLPDGINVVIFKREKKTSPVGVTP
jgi:hypothetical protein